VNKFPCVSRFATLSECKTIRYWKKWHILSFDYLLPEHVLAKYFKSDNIKAEIIGENNAFEVFKVSLFGELKHATLPEKCFSYLTYRQGKSRYSSVTLVTGYGMDGRGIGVKSPAGAREFSLLHSVQTGSGAHPASYPNGTWGSIPGVKRKGYEADHSPPPSAEVKNGEDIPPLPHTPS
jgi:hypothetical protein